MEQSTISSLQLSKLCEVCREFDFFNHVWQTIHHGDNEMPEKRPFGTIEEVGQRAIACALCTLIVARLDTLDNPEMNPHPSDRCNITFHEYATRRQRNNSEPSEPYLSARYLTIEIEPASFQGFVGPEVPANYFKPGTFTPRPTEGVEKRPWKLMNLQPCIHPVPTIDSFCRESIDQLSNMEHKFSGRLRNDQLDLRLPPRWLKICREYHGEQCWPPARPLTDRLRVIDVVGMAVVNAPKDCQYVALSYCWGSASTVICTRANMEQLAQPRALEGMQLPKTINDAIKVTRAAEIKYLWVDALCIVQDDVWMLRNQIPQMAQIYEQGLFTIIAAGGGNADAGLAGIQAGTRIVQSDVVNMGDFSLILAPEDPKGQSSTRSGLNREPLGEVRWRSRAWTLQEELFSRRRLYFESDRLFWVCPCGFYQEETEWETCVPRLPKEASMTLDLDGDIPASLTEAEPTASLYAGLVNNYSARKLTYASDSLNAFAGVLNAVFERCQVEVIWGLPEIWFAKLLVWRTSYVTGLEQVHHHASKKFKLKDDSDAEVSIPSWSWFAWTGSEGNHMFFMGSVTEAEWRRFSGIQFYRCSRDGELKPVTQEVHKENENVEEPLDSKNNPWGQDQLTGMQRRWIGSPRQIEISQIHFLHERFIDSGLLKFWTSTSTIFLHRRRTNLARATFTFDALSPYGKPLSALVNMQLTPQSVWDSNSRYETYPPSISLLHTKDGYEILAMDAIVIRIGNGFLDVLFVECEDGIAYRKGICLIEENDWIELEREWKLVTLG